MVGLLEARDWASGTSSRSSKLIHGGLRYLEQLAFPLVHEALHERAYTWCRPSRRTWSRPCRSCRPLTKPVWQQAYFGARIALYDLLGAAMKAGAVPVHRHLSQKATLAAFPGLRGDVVRGAIRYWDACGSATPRHTLAVVRTAAGYGARVLSSARVVGLLRDGDGLAGHRGVRVADLTDGSGCTVRARAWWPRPACGATTSARCWARRRPT